MNRLTEGTTSSRFFLQQQRSAECTWFRYISGTQFAVPYNFSDFQQYDPSPVVACDAVSNANFHGDTTGSDLPAMRNPFKHLQFSTLTFRDIIGSSGQPGAVHSDRYTADDDLRNDSAYASAIGNLNGLQTASIKLGETGIRSCACGDATDSA